MVQCIWTPANKFICGDSMWLIVNNNNDNNNKYAVYDVPLTTTDLLNFNKKPLKTLFFFRQIWNNDDDDHDHSYHAPILGAWPGLIYSIVVPTRVICRKSRNHHETWEEYQRSSFTPTDLAPLPLMPRERDIDLVRLLRSKRRSLGRAIVTKQN